MLGPMGAGGDREVWGEGGAPPGPGCPAGGRSEPRIPRATWSPVEAVPVFLLVFVVGSVLLSPVPALVSSCSWRYVMTVLVGEVAFATTVLGWVRFVHHGRLASLGAPIHPLVDAAVGAVAGLGLVVAAGVVLALVRAVVTPILGHPPQSPQQVVGCVRGAGLAALGPVVTVAAPIGEELYFRGFLYNSLRRRLRVIPAALLSGVLFGLVHLIVPSLSVVGVGLALVYERRGSLVASMAAHAAFNVVGYLAIALSR
jgi:membrane protease YdiL (CAAX protease family)